MKATKKKGPKILIWDLETAGVGGLSADLGFIVCFGWKWLGEDKVNCITLLDYPGVHCQDDRNLIKAANKIMEEADHLVAHYGDKFDRKFMESRLLKAKLEGVPMVRQADTCLIAREKLKLSSNRLGNLAEFLDVPHKKINKRGGWPSWWMGALRGDRLSILLMATYCKGDVSCLEDVYLRIRHLIPDRYAFNMAVGQKTWTCKRCGGHTYQHRGYYTSEKKLWKRVMCLNKSCKKWDYLARPIDGEPPKPSAADVGT